MPERAVVLLSGGLDSSINFALTARRGEAMLALTADYGQRAAGRERQAAAALCRHYGVQHRAIDLRWLGALGGSSLTDDAGEVPRIAGDELDDEGVTRRTAKSVWVPNRNGVLINVAAAHAERLGATRVVVGFNREEAQTFPDNSVEFLRRASAALALSTAGGVQVHCWTAELDKRQMVALIRREDPSFPFRLVWSCYHGGESPCGQCESCRRYDRAVNGGGA